MYSLLAAALPLLALTVVNAQSTTSCSASSQCPSETPCCGAFGSCGTGSFCLGGCNPFGSASVDSCKPMPVCQSSNQTFKDTSRILLNATEWNGDASKYDWVMEQGEILSTNSSTDPGIVLTLTEANQGTRLSSTRFVHYGTITARVKASKWSGIVLGFITMSSVKDEIDWEWPGTQVTQGQTNYFWQGEQPPHPNTVKGLTDVSENYHEYTIDWKPDVLNFLVDGKNYGTIKASDSLNGSISQFPNTPSRIQFSLWPAGIASSAPGTVSWAGGMIDWSDPDYVAKGGFQASITSVDIKCLDPTPPGSGVTSYVYGAASSRSTPNITFSTASTTIDNSSGGSPSQSGSSSSQSGSSGSSSTDHKGAASGSDSGGSSSSKLSTPAIAGIAVAGAVLLLVSALLLRMCCGGKRDTKKGGIIGTGQSYQPLSDPAPETHAVSSSNFAHGSGRYD